MRLIHPFSRFIFSKQPILVSQDAICHHLHTHIHTILGILAQPINKPEKYFGECKETREPEKKTQETQGAMWTLTLPVNQVQEKKQNWSTRLCISSYYWFSNLLVTSSCMYPKSDNETSTMKRHGEENLHSEWVSVWISHDWRNSFLIDIICRKKLWHYSFKSIHSFKSIKLVSVCCAF